MKGLSVKRIVQGISVAGMIATVLYLGWLWHCGILTDQARMNAYIGACGVWGYVVFLVIQVVQVVVPIIPGGISCAVGVMAFGAWKGFVLNYVGICVGSLIAFLLAKTYGRPLMFQLFDRKLIHKYDHWTSTKGRFNKLFALAIFSPVAPDDFLCYLAGTTTMRLTTFVWIILLGKPTAIAMYSTGLNLIWKFITGA